MTPRKALWWSLLAALICGAVGAVVAAGVWGGTPWRQIPLVVLSMLVGSFLPLGTTAVARRLGQETSAEETPNAVRVQSPEKSPNPSSVPQPQPGPPGRTTSALGFPRREFAFNAPHLSDGEVLGIGAMGAFMGVMGLVLLLSQDARTGMFDRGPSAVDILPLSLLLLVIGIGTVTILTLVRVEPRRLIFDDQGLTVTVRRFRVRLRWDEVTEIRIKDGFLMLRVPFLSEEHASRINGIVAHTKGYEAGTKVWSTKAPMVAVCDLNALSFHAEILQAVEHYSGRETLGK